MKKRWWISVIALFPGVFAGAQTVKPAVKPLLLTSGSVMSFMKEYAAPFKHEYPGRPLLATGFTLKPVKLLSLPDQKFPSPEPITAPVYRMAPDAYYQQHFGFFCKQEWSWQKQTGIPVKLRLGSYSYAQQQEGKQ